MNLTIDEFTDGLLKHTAQRIPAEYDWFDPLIGDWEFDYYDQFDQGQPRHVIGEWIFRKILEGTGVEDLFICPSRATRDSAPQPDGEYGVALRMFNAAQKCYDMVYACETYMIRVKFEKKGELLVGTILDHPDHKFVFSNITDTTFTWENVEYQEDGTQKIFSRILARRKDRQ